MSAKLFVLYTLLLVLVQLNHHSTAERCDRTLSSTRRSTADGSYQVGILGDPKGYVPGTSYSVSLYGIKQIKHNAPKKFTQFKLSVSSSNASNSALEDFSNTRYGTFMRYANDTFTELECGNLLKHTSTQAKDKIEVEWIAPSAGTGCVMFRASVMESRDFWYMDDGPLSKEFCEDESATQENGKINLECCACSEAKYKFAFEGKWSRNTHPKDFPSNVLMARFTDVIGASHSINYEMWNNQVKPTKALQELVENGDSTAIERELLDSIYIRTIIKARGLVVNETGPTLTIFRVDQHNHLMSFVSKIHPSPDWFVGVAKQDLCTPDCSWVAKKETTLYPWHAGTDNGPSYLSPDEPVLPYNSIRPLDRSSDTRSPFFSSKQQRTAPFGQLTLTLERIYDMPCKLKSESMGPTNNQPARPHVNGEDINECNGQPCITGHERLPSTPLENCTVGVQMSACNATCGESGFRNITTTTIVDNECNNAPIPVACNRHSCHNNNRCSYELDDQMKCKGRRKIIYYYSEDEACCKSATVNECASADESRRNLFSNMKACLKECYSTEEPYAEQNWCKRADVINE